MGALLVGTLLTNLIVGFLAGAVIRRTIWRVLIGFTLPLVVAILAVHPQPLFAGGEEEFGAELIFAVLMFTGFGATGTGLVLGALFRAYIQNNPPKIQDGANNQSATDAPADCKD